MPEEIDDVYLYIYQMFSFINFYKISSEKQKKKNSFSLSHPFSWYRSVLLSLLVLSELFFDQFFH